MHIALDEEDDDFADALKMFAAESEMGT